MLGRRPLFIVTLLVFSFSTGSFSQSNDHFVDSLAIRYSSTITAEDLKEHLTIFASDEFLGRETAREGQKKAQNYLVEAFRKMGVEGGNDGKYVMPFDVVIEQPTGKMIIDQKEYSFLSEFYFYQPNPDTTLSADEIVFAGYGIEDENYNEYEGLDVKDKFVLILEDEPYDKDSVSLITGTKEESAWSFNWRKKYKTAKANGAKGVISIVRDYENKKTLVEQYLSQARMRLSKGDDLDNPDFRMPSIYISEELGDQILKKSGKNIEKVKKKIRKKGPVTFSISSDITMEFQGQGEYGESSNVLAFIPGTEKPEEVLIITAHYDHLGSYGELIYNGADDDGSGTVSLLEIAEAFSLASKSGHGPKRSILFMPVSGEEKGLLGSKYYVENPVYPLDQTIADLNIDMIGRTDDEHDHPDYIYLIGSNRLSTELHDLSERVNETYVGFELDYTYNDPEDPNNFYYRSDHYNFAKNNIPVIFYFSGIHEDYHQPTDTSDKIEYDKLEKSARLVFFTAWELANRPERVKVDVAPDVFDR